MTSVSYEQKNTDEVLYPSITICPTYSNLGSYALWGIAPKPPKVFIAQHCEVNFFLMSRFFLSGIQRG